MKGLCVFLLSSRQMCVIRSSECWLGPAGWRSWCWTTPDSKGQRSNKRIVLVVFCTWVKLSSLTDLCMLTFHQCFSLYLTLNLLPLVQWFCSEAGQRSVTEPRLHATHTQPEQQLTGRQRFKHTHTHVYSVFIEWIKFGMQSLKVIMVYSASWKIFASPSFILLTVDIFISGLKCVSLTHAVKSALSCSCALWWSCWRPSLL